jgi:hypothetical protein
MVEQVEGVEAELQPYPLRGAERFVKPEIRVVDAAGPHVVSSSTLSVTSASLTFTQATGGSSPPSQTLSVTSTGATSTGGQITFAATVSLNQGQGWLTVTPSNATTPATLTVSANGSVDFSESGPLRSLSGEVRLPGRRLGGEPHWQLSRRNDERHRPNRSKGFIRASSKFFPRSATETEIAASLRTLETDPESKVQGH